MRNEFMRLIENTYAEDFIDEIRTTDDGLSYLWNGFTRCEVVLQFDMFLDRFDCERRTLDNGDFGKVWQTEREFASLGALAAALIKDANKIQSGRSKKPTEPKFKKPRAGSPVKGAIGHPAFSFKRTQRVK